MSERTGVRRRLLLATLAPLLLAVAVISPAAGWAASGDSDNDGKPLPETEVQAPPFPQTENLLPFTVSATTDNQFMVDSESLSVSGDGIVRFTLVIVTAAGAHNVSYEAINCLTSERRLYFLGRSDKTWSTARNSQWVKIRDNTLNRHYAELYTNYFCPIGITIGSADEARRALRRGGHPAARQH